MWRQIPLTDMCLRLRGNSLSWLLLCLLAKLQVLVVHLSRLEGQWSVPKIQIFSKGLRFTRSCVEIQSLSGDNVHSFGFAGMQSASRAIVGFHKLRLYHNMTLRGKCQLTLPYRDSVKRNGLSKPTKSARSTNCLFSDLGYKSVHTPCLSNSFYPRPECQIEVPDSNT